MTQDLTPVGDLYKIAGLFLGAPQRSAETAYSETDIMYAVIQTGGKQYRVNEGATVRVEKLPAEEGATVELDKVQLIGNGDARRDQLIRQLTLAVSLGAFVVSLGLWAGFTPHWNWVTR